MVTRGRKFSNSKRAGRNASEPRRSLVNELEKPTLWSEGEGRWIDAEITEVASIDFRGSSGNYQSSCRLNIFVHAAILCAKSSFLCSSLMC